MRKIFIIPVGVILIIIAYNELYRYWLTNYMVNGFSECMAGTNVMIVESMADSTRCLELLNANIDFLRGFLLW